jgi:7-cyano-7-deazaguanine reductase
VDDLTLLGGQTRDRPDHPSKAKLETFPNAYPNSDYEVVFHCGEFTSLCPVTGQPDFAKITVKYQPDRKCIESKSLKLYLGSFRNVGMFHEEICNRILEDCKNACDPKWIEVTGNMNVRGGIAIDVVARYRK